MPPSLVLRPGERWCRQDYRLGYNQRGVGNRGVPWPRRPERQRPGHGWNGSRCWRPNLTTMDRYDWARMDRQAWVTTAGFGEHGATSWPAWDAVGLAWARSTPLGTSGDGPPRGQPRRLFSRFSVLARTAFGAPLARPPQTADMHFITTVRARAGIAGLLAALALSLAPGAATSFAAAQTSPAWHTPIDGQEIGSEPANSFLMGEGHVCDPIRHMGC
jgi:hypothetical protein